ncbi:hypothetical protein RHMOL_Rhmol06G0105000 [Rhododendron molle]|uniref:Uncharacterized protein n=1 Tax=Rhododendron molle TaxID=49168 RepID=A0ACC0NC96_RHOML|nr:hypothetical protein RHMOL_Rhmol06G0105000 [Rhododendron molle]
MGMNRKSKAFLHGVRTMSSMTIENWELKLELFRRLGFSEEGIALAFKKSPQAFASRRGKLRRSHWFSLVMGDSISRLLLATHRFFISALEAGSSCGYELWIFLKARICL